VKYIAGGKKRKNKYIVEYLKNTNNITFSYNFLTWSRAAVEVRDFPGERAVALLPSIILFNL